MQQTSKYQFNLVEGSDDFSPTPLNQNMEKVEEVLETLDAAVDEAQSTAKNELLTKLRRDGYDLYQVTGRAARNDLLTFPPRGMVINGLHTAAELARAGICVHLEQGGIQIGPVTGLSLAKINSAAYDWIVGNAPEIADSATASVKFRSAFRGTITKLNVWYHRTNVNNTGQLPLYVRLYDQDTGVQIYQSEKLTGEVMSYTDTTDTLNVSVPIEPNRHYRLELYTSGDVFTGTIGFGVMSSNGLTGEASAQVITSCAVTDSIALDTPADQAVAVVHYSGGSQAPTVTLGGQTMVAGTPKTATALDGTSCTELEFFLAETFTGTQTLTTSFQSASDMILHDTGAYFN